MECMCSSSLREIQYRLYMRYIAGQLFMEGILLFCARMYFMLCNLCPVKFFHNTLSSEMNALLKNYF